jgi:transposase
VNGYVHEFLPEHPSRNAWGFVRQHQLVAEDMLGRPLAKGEVVHHVDENRANNDPANLRVMHFADHLRLHSSKRLAANRAPLTHEQVVAALEGRSIKAAAKLLDVCTETLRNRFPELIRPRQRTSPVKIDNPRDLDRILEAAPRRDVLLKDLARELHISTMSILRICRRNGVPWKKKLRSDVGGVRPRYRGKPTIRRTREGDDPLPGSETR